MSTATLHNHGAVHHAGGHDHEEHHDHDDGKTEFGFWVYLMTDLILFATLFVTYSVMVNNTVDGPTGKDLFQLPLILVETFLLLASSFTFGLGMLAAYKGNKNQLLGWLAVTGVLGLGFLAIEIYEFHHLISIGAGPGRSAFLSAFFTLVGTHGLHVASGTVWLVLLMVQVQRKGLTPRMMKRLACLSLFWHFLDIVWICVFSIVYLLGAL